MSVCRNPPMVQSASAPDADDPPAQGRRRRSFILRLACTLVLIGLVLTQVNLRDLQATIAGAQWLLVLAALGAAMAERAVSTIRWWLLLRAKGVHVSPAPLFGLHMTASFAGSFLPTTFGSDAVRITMLARQTGRTVDCIAASIVDRVIMVLCTIAAAALAVAAAAVVSPEVRWLVAGIAAAAFLGVLLVASRRMMGPVGALVRLTLGQRIAGVLARIYQGMDEYRARPWLFIGCAIISGAVLLIRFGCTWLIAMALGIEVSPLVLLVVLPVIAVIVMAPVSVGGVGLQEGAFIVLLGAAGVPAAAAMSISLLEHVVTRLATVPGALFWLARPRAEPSAGAAGLVRGMVAGGAGVRR